ncbi:MAG: hypothetical protein CMH78_01695 [Nitrospinae bacterium]|jgi:hypothetical protein|nr:hypothetical protein [Nitrospinota bacterium]|tara:strand:+ start:649 stop:894 length:246 start_codon:yes stop_codon:yes gene_type:complete
MTDVREKGLDCLSEEWIRGDLSEFRIFELAATLNRFRSLKVKQISLEVFSERISSSLLRGASISGNLLSPRLPFTPVLQAV